jgi:hypothetical protein
VISDFQSVANLGFVYATVLTRVLKEWEERPTQSTFGPFWDYSLLEAALWLKLGLDTEYLKPSHVREAVDHLEPALLTAYARIHEAQEQPVAQKEISSWCNFIAIEADGPKLLREVFFAEGDAYVNEGDQIRSTYQNYLLLCSEMAYEQSNTKFLAALNFESDEHWKRICSGDLAYNGITGQDFSLATIQILEFLVEMASEEATLPIINYQARSILRWKLNLADATVADRFLQACRLVFDSALQPVDAISRRSALSYVGILFSYVTSSWTGSLSYVSSEARLDRSIEELDLSVRSYNGLKNANINSLRDLVQKTEADLLRTGHVGRKSVEEIGEVLARLGLRLGMSVGVHGKSRISDAWAPPGRAEHEEGG